MGRQKTEDAKVVGSSIALLRERFRELQRIKLIREEQQQQREALVRSPQPAQGDDAENLRRTADCSLSLGLGGQGSRRASVGANGLWPGVGAVQVSGGSTGLRHGPDHVDTSLHL
ncbi:hypothetical protein MLD38_029247 [Melastoma candidum]|uniref:Uncharacterized protein n=1 Tax=Melastoma candidum TaxID=119954 RepID=A0ACB9N514_9MYRT|nr:hypothetical protein MLD38_029247 [Melastoma candidum]